MTQMFKCPHCGNHMVQDSEPGERFLWYCNECGWDEAVENSRRDDG